MDHQVISRYRNITVLVLVVGAQFLLLAYQVKSRQDMAPVRVWAVGGFLPVAKLLDFVRDNTTGRMDRYANLVRAQSENDQLKLEVDKLRLENQYLKRELGTAERGQALALFKAAAPHQLLAARVVGTSTAPGSRVVFVDCGLADGVRAGMAVMTPAGIVGRVNSAQTNGAQVLLLTDSNFAAGVISEKSHVIGIAKGQGHGTVLVDYVQNEEPLEVGEMFYTSGDDMIFPRGLPVGSVKVSRRGRGLFKEIFVVPTGLDRGIEAVLIVLHGQAQPVPGETALPQSAGPGATAPAAVPAEAGAASAGNSVPIDADLVLRRYESASQVQGHRLGAGPAPSFVNLPAAGSTPPPTPPARKNGPPPPSPAP